MSEQSEQQTQKPDDRPEYLKFIAFLVVVLVAILALAALSPRISEVTPAVLGLDGDPAAQPVQVDGEDPAAGGAPAPVDPAGSESPVEVEGAAAPEQLSPDAGLGGLEAEVQGLQHEVLPGQTLFQIAEEYGVSVQELAAANNLVNPLQLQPGTVLIIPQSP